MSKKQVRFAEIGQMLRAERMRQDLSQQKFADKYHVSKDIVTYAECGYTYPPDVLADLLGIEHGNTRRKREEAAPKRSDIGVGKRAKVCAVTFGEELQQAGSKWLSVQVPQPCVCESINRNGVAVLRFDVRGKTLYECFRLEDPALLVEWRNP